MREIWKPIPQYESFYEVSNLGRVRRICAGGPARAGQLVKGSLDNCGYPRVRLCRSSLDQKQFRIHVLVMLAFVGERNGKTVNHKNRIRDDNNLKNLEYLSHADNIRHSSASYSKPGEKNHRATLKEKDVLQIRKLHSDGLGLTEIAKLFTSNKYTIFDIVHRRSWKHL